jgi:hypothetical protein
MERSRDYGQAVKNRGWRRYFTAALALAELSGCAGIEYLSAVSGGMRVVEE